MMRHIEKVFTAELLGGSPAPATVSAADPYCQHAALGLHLDRADTGEPSAYHSAPVSCASCRRRPRPFAADALSEFFPEIANHLSAEQLRQFGASYVEHLRSRAPAAERVTDKMPSNYLYIGLTHMALPNARIIHARRDPLDTCLSCFRITSEHKSFTSDLGSLGRYYRSYEALMAHWRPCCHRASCSRFNTRNSLPISKTMRGGSSSFAGWTGTRAVLHSTRPSVRSAPRV